MSSRLTWFRKDHLYGALLWNVLPPFVVLIAMLGMILALVYANAIVGGQAWIQSSAKGALPQVIGFLEEEGLRCSYEEVRLQGSSCTATQAHTGDVPFSPGALLDKRSLQKSEIPLFGGHIDPKIFSSAMSADEAISGFAVLSGRLVHLSKLPNNDQILVRDVTDRLLHRLSRAGAIEVEIFSAESGEPLATTFRSVEDTEVFSIGPPPARGMQYRKIVFDKPYRGYVSRLDDEEVFMFRGMREFTSFARDYTPPQVKGMDSALIVISVPQQVMLGYTDWMIYCSILVTLLVIFLTFFFLRRLTFQQIQPILEVVARVRLLGASIRSDGDLPNIPSNVTELESLRYAVKLLEETIEENKHLEKHVRQSERLEAIGRLTGGIAHDFNNLLGIVVANCSFLREDIEDPEILKSVDDISAAAKSATEMTSSLLAFSAGRSPNVLGGSDIAPIVQSAVSLVGRSIGSSVEFSLDITEHSIASVSSAHIQQLILNLVLNASDAAKGEKAHVYIQLGPAKRPPVDKPNDASQDWICLSVQDDGVGMSEEVKEHIFEPFFTNKRFSSERGSGLGLSVVYGIVEGAGGFIEVQSTEGQGSSFSIYLPRTEMDEEETDEPHEKCLLNMSALLVEDDHGVRRAMRSMLMRLGMKVIDFESGLQVESWLKDSERGEIDVLVTDVRMPVHDGYQVTAMCRSRLPGLPVVFMTGYDADASLRDEIPLSRLVMKPLSSDDLSEAILAVVSLRQ